MLNSTIFYIVIRAFIIAATKLNIATFSIQGNGYLYNLHNTYFVYPTNNDYWCLNKSKKWSSHWYSPIKTLSAFRVFRHLKYLISARSGFTYSSPPRSKSAEKLEKIFVSHMKNRFIFLQPQVPTNCLPLVS